MSPQRFGFSLFVVLVVSLVGFSSCKKRDFGNTTGSDAQSDTSTGKRDDASFDPREQPAESIKDRLQSFEQGNQCVRVYPFYVALNEENPSSFEDKYGTRLVKQDPQIEKYAVFNASETRDPQISSVCKNNFGGLQQIWLRKSKKNDVFTIASVGTNKIEKLLDIVREPAALPTSEGTKSCRIQNRDEMIAGHAPDGRIWAFYLARVPGSLGETADFCKLVLMEQGDPGKRFALNWKEKILTQVNFGNGLREWPPGCTGCNGMSWFPKQSDGDTVSVVYFFFTRSQPSQKPFATELANSFQNDTATSLTYELAKKYEVIFYQKVALNEKNEWVKSDLISFPK